VLLSNSDVEKLLAARVRYGVQASDDGQSLVTSGCDLERVTLTRAELDALIEEAIEKDRSRR
jgi:hypothetical protein